MLTPPLSSNGASELHLYRRDNDTKDQEESPRCAVPPSRVHDNNAMCVTRYLGNQGSERMFLPSTSPKAVKWRRGVVVLHPSGYSRLKSDS